jgi:hypothetical protein
MASMAAMQLQLGASASSALASSNNVMSGSSNSATGLRPLYLRSLPKRASGAAHRRQQRVSYKGPSALFGGFFFILKLSLEMWIICSLMRNFNTNRMTQNVDLGANLKIGFEGNYVN